MLEKCKRYGYCSFTIQKLIKIMFLYPRSKGHIHFILVFLFVCPPVCLFITIILQRFLNYFKLHVLEILPHSFVYVSHMMGLFFVQKKRPLPLEKRRCHFKLYFSKKIITDFSASILSHMLEMLINSLLWHAI